MKRTNGKLTNVYEIAHIYPLNPTESEVKLLENEGKLSKDVNSEDNLISLCRDCHKVFDAEKTVEEYKKLMETKKRLQKTARIKNGFYDYSLENEIKGIVNRLATIKNCSLVELSLNALKVEDKADDTLSFATQIKIKNYVVYFYNDIKNQFTELDKNKPYTSDTIYGQVKSHYLKLKKEGLDQYQIFEALTEWVKTATKTQNKEAAEIVVSFFIQNCEVFS